MTIPNLPNELRGLVVRHISTTNDLLSLLVTDSAFLSFAQPVLYRYAKLKLDDRPRTKRTLQWCWTILKRPELAFYVRELWVEDYGNELGSWIAGGALHSIIVKVLSLLQNLKTFRLMFAGGYPSPLREALFHFPNLESLECLVTNMTMPFLERHPGIRRLHVLGYSEMTPSPQGKAIGILPNLTHYAGPPELVRHLASTASLQRVVTSIHARETLGMLKPLFDAHGVALRSFDLSLLSREHGVLKQVATQAPNLEHLVLRQFFLRDILDSGVRLIHLQGLELHSVKTLARSPVPPDSEILPILHQLAPMLRFVRLSHFPDKAQKGWWRYNESKQLWIPPKSVQKWWKTTALDHGITLDDYRNAQLDGSTVHGPFIPWHPLL